MLSIVVAGKVYKVKEKEYSNGEVLTDYSVIDFVEPCCDVEILWQWEKDSEIATLEELVSRLRNLIRGMSDIRLTVLYMPYISDIQYNVRDMYKKGAKLQKLKERINALNVDKVRVVDPKNVESVLGINNLELYKLDTLIEDCERDSADSYDYVCYMSQYKKRKYELQGIDARAFYYVPKLSTFNEEEVVCDSLIGVNPKALLGAKILIVDDTCYTGNTYAKLLDLFLSDYINADAVDIYITQLSEEIKGKDGLLKTKARNIYTLYGAESTELEVMDDGWHKLAVYNTIEDKKG